MPRPVSVAITGGIGAGKTEALRAFARHGAAVVSSDEIVHRLLVDDGEIKAAIRERLGGDVFDEDGEVVRSSVAKRVFPDEDAREWLEALLHPKVVREYLSWRDEQARKAEPPAVTVTEVPLLYEVGGESRFERVVVITAPVEVRASRHPLADARGTRLLPDEEKARRADFVFVNDGTLDELDRFVASVMKELSRSS